MKQMTCIVCPVGCSLEIDDTKEDLPVSGNRCTRGAAYAHEEIREPKRVVTATCGIDMANAPEPRKPELGGPRRIPVKTASPCPRDKVTDLLADIYRAKVTLPVKAGDVIIDNWKGIGIKVIAARSMD